MYQTPKKMSKEKKIELIVLIVLILWGILFIINYVRYTEGKTPILALHIERKYDDGVVNEYISFGYVYRAYNRVSITKKEMVPFWIGLKNPEALPDLPVVDTDYEVPENIKRYDKYKGLLYYYSRKGELLGTYKCINTVLGCNKAFGGYDQYNTTNKDALTKHDPYTLGMIYETFAFVDDSLKQESEYGDLNYSRIIYLYRFLEDDEHKPEIIAKFADVKMSTLDEDYDIGYGENNRYIVKSMDTGKWGLIKIDKDGEIIKELDYVYDSISYDEDTDYYILCKDGIWFIYDLYKKSTVSAESVDPIYDVWKNNNHTYYFKTGRDRTIGDDTFVDYRIFRIDGNEFLNIEKVTEVLARDTFVMYLTSEDSVLHFMDYGKTERYKIKLYFSEMHYDDFSHPAFQLYAENKGVLLLRIYKGRELKYDYDTKAVNTNIWDAND
ncbi:MAG: hypothetical protein ACI4XM_04590 [Candidatus Coprovivens sp.]